MRKTERRNPESAVMFGSSEHGFGLKFGTDLSALKSFSCAFLLGLCSPSVHLSSFSCQVIIYSLHSLHHLADLAITRGHCNFAVSRRADCNERKLHKISLCAVSCLKQGNYPHLLATSLLPRFNMRATN